MCKILFGIDFPPLFVKGDGTRFLHEADEGQPTGQPAGSSPALAKFASAFKGITATGVMGMSRRARALAVTF